MGNYKKDIYGKRILTENLKTEKRYNEKGKRGNSGDIKLHETIETITVKISTARNDTWRRESCYCFSTEIVGDDDAMRTTMATK